VVKLFVAEGKAIRDKLVVADEVSNFIGSSLSTDEFPQLVDAICKYLPPSIGQDVVSTTLSPLLSQEVTEEGLDEMFWRLTGNLDLLRAGRPATGWCVPVVDTWCPVLVLRADKRTERKRAGYFLRMRMLQGPGSGMIVGKFFSNRFLKFIAGDFGFSQRAALPYVSALDMVLLQCCVSISPKSSDKPKITKVTVLSSQKVYNKQQLQIRFRKPKVFSCPKLFKHACRQCPIGYKDCVAGTHEFTFKSMLCDICKSKAWFDPELSEEMCIGCYNKFSVVGDPV